MLVLALDTSLSACSVALVDIAAEGETVRAAETERLTRGHAEALMPMVERVMNTAGATFGEVDRFAATAGPGGFTGVRIALSAARSFALAGERPAVGVSTLAALAAAAFGNDAEPVASVIDARRDEAHWQLFALPGRPLTPAILSTYHRIAHSLDSPHVRIAGPGAERLAAEEPKRFHVVSREEVPDIVWVARLGAHLDPTEAPPDPVYSRPPDAKLQRDRSIGSVEDSETPWPPRFPS